jgi:hypothetical protein
MMKSHLLLHQGAEEALVRNVAVGEAKGAQEKPVQWSAWTELWFSGSLFTDSRCMLSCVLNYNNVFFLSSNA